MDGKRVSQQELLEQTNKNRGGKAGWIAAAAAAGPVSYTHLTLPPTPYV